jgi:hypothetical protein
MANQFFIIFLFTILITRLFLFLKPVPALTVAGFRTHHWMYGVLGVFLGIIFRSLFLYSIGLGLFIDELTYILIGGKNHNDNYSKMSLFGTILFILIVFLLKEYFIIFI